METDPSHPEKEIAILKNHVVLFVVFILSIIRGAYIWIVKYKLQYFLRISLFLFVCSFIIYRSPTINIFEWETLPVFALFCQKKLFSDLCLWSGITCMIMLFARYHWGLPINIVKDNDSIEFTHLENLAISKRCSVRQLSRKMLRHKNPGEHYPVYVNGWIPLIESNEVASGQVVSVVAIGYKFCVYRGESGQVFVLDAYCPHLGADLSAGGQVIGNSIECPFHGWQFCGNTGACLKIPCSKKIPDIAKTKVWESTEKNGYIFIWHHAELEPPSWEIPSIKEIENNEWIYRGRSDFSVNCHIQELPENGADISHLAQLHSRFALYGPSIVGIGQRLQHQWKPQWDRDETQPHVAKASLEHRLALYGFEIPWTRTYVNFEQIGPAIVHMHLQTRAGRCVILQYITTEGPLSQRIVQLLYSEPKCKRGPSIFTLWLETIMLQRDMAVWNNKTFLKKPLLVKSDKFLSRFRQWYSQFYSQHSPRLQDVRRMTLNW